MHIEVIANSDSPKKNQGDVLENFAAEWLKIYGYSVTQNVRKTASEPDDGLVTRFHFHSQQKADCHGKKDCNGT